MKQLLSNSAILMSLVVAALLASGCSKSNPQNALSSASTFDSGIIGGEEVTPAEEMAKSTVGLEAPGYGVYCTGVLVAKNLVATAGHCTGVTLYPNRITIVFGSDLTGKVIRKRVQGGKVTDAWPQLTADKSNNWGDIALLRFEDQAPEGFAPVRLLGDATQLKDGMDATLVGYGLTDMETQVDPGKLMKANVKIQNAKFSETEISFGQTDGKGACHGDSGGPAYATINGKLFLIGVTSRSLTEAGGMTCLEGSIYTSIPGEIAFLKKAAVYLNSKDFVPNQPIPQPEEEP